MGLLSIIPRDAEGVPLDLTRLADYVIRDENGIPVKEWFAIASYLQTMGGKMDSRYAQPDGRKVVYSSLNPVYLLRNANQFTWILLAVVFLLVCVTSLIVRVICRRKKNRK